MDKKQAIVLFLDMLKAYNETTNIYSKKAYDKLDFHIDDGLQLAELIGNTNRQVVDIGSGAGFPSVIIAIQNPLNQVIAVESKSRKTRFLNQVKDELHLSNFEVNTVDIQTYINQTSSKVDVVTAKAFGSYEKVFKYAKLMAKKGAEMFIPISQRQCVDYQSQLNEKTVDFIQFPERSLFYLRQTF